MLSTAILRYPANVQTKLPEASAVEKISRLGAEIPVWLNVGIILGQLVGIAACCYAAARVTNGWLLVGLALTFGVLMNSVYSIIHEAEHAMLFTNRRWNDAAGAFMALFFPAPFHLIRQGHLGHHFRNRSDDEAFDFYFEGDHRLWRYLVLYGILTGCYWIVVVLSNVVFLLVPFAANKKYWNLSKLSPTDSIGMRGGDRFAYARGLVVSHSVIELRSHVFRFRTDLVGHAICSSLRNRASCHPWRA